MSTNEKIVRAMIDRGSQADRMLGEYWLRCNATDRACIEKNFVPEFSKWRRVLDYQAADQALKLKEVA